MTHIRRMSPQLDPDADPRVVNTMPTQEESDEQTEALHTRKLNREARDLYFFIGDELHLKVEPARARRVS